MSFAGEAAPASRRRPSAILHRTSVGTLAVAGASALRLILQFALLPILARLVGPSEYGLVSLAMPFILLANVLADGGLAVALGRQRDVGVSLESSAFWLASGAGLGLAAVSCLTAVPIGAFLHQPRLPLLIMALSPILVMNSLTAVSNGRIIRERRFGVFAAGDLISTVAGATTALVAATHGWGAWSLVAQQLVLWVGKLAWLSLKAGTRIRFVYRFAEVGSLVRFGLNTLGASLSDFVSRNVDNMIIGGVLGATALGYYAMAYQVVRIPDMLISGPFYFYIFTAMARTAQEGRMQDIRDLAKAGLRLGATGVAPLFCGLALIADLAVKVLLGPKWLGAIDALRWLSGAGLCFCLTSLMAAMLMGLGRSGLQLRLSALLGVTTVATVGLSARFGVGPASAALSTGLALVFGLYLHQLARDLLMPRRELLTALAPAIVGCAVMTLVVLAVRRVLAAEPAGLALAVVILAGGLGYAAVILALARRRLMDDLRAFSRAHADLPEPVGGESPVGAASEPI